ncbi:MarR family winged helix-turn-helix transcriptional regulator [uncultured Methanobrevibacter sp.]|uniref:MarR family winged helix-turn-helix transcriptional regulator n=1 Tax=uncultured Methanobrevibacter sp. TaxID=253161 RepID=UPI0025D0714A|nr:MarR family transcriptional regulator [uncultured Methanobrevibacter sp.]
MKFEKTMGFYDSNRLGDILFIFHKNHKTYLNDELSKYDLSLISALCILMIHESEELNQKDLSDGLYLTKGAITKSVKKLERDGWILRERSENDKRHFILKLTSKGNNFIPIMKEVNDKWESEMGLDGLNYNFRKTFIELTHRAIDLNLKKENGKD